MEKKHERHSITINHSTFLRLKGKGFFGESFSDLISRIMDEIEISNPKQDVFPQN
jgi:hypothetical protein